VKAIIAISKSLQLEIIAECVETEAQAILLESYGCYYMQGFLFSKPLPAEEFSKLLWRELAMIERKPEIV
jgi:EAL domain-containing protein (putative c-di-GMP-specific phosphodiesterase class I)